MLDLAQCPKDDSVLFWTSLSWQLFNLLTTPTLVLPLLFILIALPWGMKRFPYKRQWSGLITACWLIYLVAFTPKAVAVGNRFLVNQLPEDSGVSADAIVILGRGEDLRQERVNVAAQLWKERRAPLLFASGRGDALEIAQRLRDQGIPQRTIDGEPCSRTTAENAQFTAEQLRPLHVRRIILVTDPPHMLRALLTFQGLGFEIVPHPNPLPTTLSIEKRGLLVFREYFGLMSYELKGRFSTQSASVMSHGSISNLPTSSPS
jgi:uncharacterized SAM-binding protein YcdF (DUF218 family)